MAPCSPASPHNQNTTHIHTPRFLNGSLAQASISYALHSNFHFCICFQLILRSCSIAYCITQKKTISKISLYFIYLRLLCSAFFLYYCGNLYRSQYFSKFILKTECSKTKKNCYITFFFPSLQLKISYRALFFYSSLHILLNHLTK